MADIRIKDLATTASSTASDDFLAVDGSANGTRKLNAFSPTFGGNVVATGTLTVNSTTDSSSKDTGAIVTEGGLGVEKSASIGGNLTVSGTGTSYIEAARSSIIGGSPRFQIENSSAPYYKSSIALIGNANSSGNEAVVMFAKSRGTTNGSVTAVQSGDTIGGLYWTGADGTSLNTNAAAFLTQVDGAVSTGSVPLRYIWQIAASEKMRLNSSGNLLLKSDGIDSGNGKLQLATHTTSAGGIGFGTDTSFFRGGHGNLQVSASAAGQWSTLQMNAYDTNSSAATSYVPPGTLSNSNPIWFVGQRAGELGGLKMWRYNGSNHVAAAFTIDTSDNATFAGSIAIGNTVNTVSPTSPNRTITIVVGGTTYYIPAKTTND